MVYGKPFLAWLLIAMGLSLPRVGHAEVARNTRQMEALSSQAADRVIRQDLLSILKPVPKISSEMFRQLRGVGLSTQPYGTEYPGLCRRDILSLSYAPTTDERYEDAPIRPYGVEAHPLFHVVSLPSRFDGAPDPKSAWQPTCAHLGEASWFFAADAFHAVQGVLVMEEAIRRVRAGNLTPVPCPSLSQSGPGSCQKAILAAGKREQIDSIAACAAEPKDICYEIDLASSIKLTIKARGGGDDPTPSEILSISVEEYIIVT